MLKSAAEAAAGSGNTRQWPGVWLYLRGTLRWVSSQKGSIQSALSQVRSDAFRAQAKGEKSPYGDGTAAMKMAKILADLPDRKTLLKKPVIPLLEQAGDDFNPTGGAD